MMKKQSVQAIRRGVRIVNRKPGSRINSGLSEAVKNPVSMESKTF